jgi:histidinol-phosphatase
MSATELLLAAVGEVARLTAGSALTFYRRGLRVELKPDGTEVTAADREAERVAREWISRRFPGDAIMGEELGTSGHGARRRWLIDPIDGTRSFVRGVPLWGSIVAVEEDGEVVAAAISCPVVGETVAAARGEGCWHNDSRATVSEVSRLSEATVLATDARFPAHPWRRSRWQVLASKVAVARTWGDCYGYVLVATGRADVMIDDALHPWDSAALVPILAESGGVVSDWRGVRGKISTDAVATNAALAATVHGILGIPERMPAPELE